MNLARHLHFPLTALQKELTSWHCSDSKQSSPSWTAEQKKTNQTFFKYFIIQLVILILHLEAINCRMWGRLLELCDCRMLEYKEGKRRILKNLICLNTYVTPMQSQSLKFNFLFLKKISYSWKSQKSWSILKMFFFFTFYS